MYHGSNEISRLLKFTISQILIALSYEITEFNNCENTFITKFLIQRCLKSDPSLSKKLVLFPFI